VTVDRRGFLGLAGTTLGLLALGSLFGVAVAPRRARAAALTGVPRLVVINMKGGNDGLNMVIPVSQARYYTRRPTIGIPEASALSLAGGPTGVATAAHRLHPELVRTQALWDEGSVGVIQKVGYPNPNLSHFSSEDIWSFGARSTQGAASGWVARLADRLALAPGATPMDVVGIGLANQKDFFGAANTPLTVDSLARFRFDSDSAFSQNHLLRVATVKDRLLSRGRLGLEDEVKRASERAHALSGQVQASVASFTGGAAYPTTTLGNRLKDVATLIQGGFATRVFYTGYGGFDTHSNQAAAGGATGGDHTPLMDQLDNALGAFADQMKAMGVWNDMVVVVISEFGRRNYENGSAGTDHGHANCVLVLGGAVSGGIHGADITDADLAAEFLPASVDFRSVYQQLLGAHLGVADPGSLFPEGGALAGSPGAFV